MDLSNSEKQLEYRLGRWLAGLREESGLSQEALAIQLGKGQSDIAKIESGKRKFTVLEFLSFLLALGVPLEKGIQGLKPIFEELKGEDSFWRGK